MGPVCGTVPKSTALTENAASTGTHTSTSSTHTLSILSTQTDRKVPLNAIPKAVRWHFGVRSAMFRLRTSRWDI
jgi:hypothetical protein